MKPLLKPFERLLTHLGCELDGRTPHISIGAAEGIADETHQARQLKALTAATPAHAAHTSQTISINECVRLQQARLDPLALSGAAEDV